MGDTGVERSRPRLAYVIYGTTRRNSTFHAIIALQHLFTGKRRGSNIRKTRDTPQYLYCLISDNALTGRTGHPILLLSINKKIHLNQTVKDLRLLRMNHSSVLLTEGLIQTGKPLTEQNRECPWFSSIILGILKT
jgi:hypothetical protein